MKAAVVTLSDKGFRNEREDKSGELVQMMLKEAGYEVAEYRLLPDEQTQIETVLKELSDEKEMDLILTTAAPRLFRFAARLWRVKSCPAPGLAVLPAARQAASGLRHGQTKP